MNRPTVTFMTHVTLSPHVAGGYARNLTAGIIRARYKYTSATPVLIEPGKVYEYTIELWTTNHLFKAGYRIRVEISSSNFPRFDRNPNTPHPFAHRAAMT
jgi:predicted acyl esterase